MGFSIIGDTTMKSAKQNDTLRQLSVITAGRSGPSGGVCRMAFIFS